ncbi:MAG TPA: hypothetical protein EYQ06_04540 [Flavobacteriales bacterium]|nr:hypothetical protein [Flavobacteriales bacterium]HIK62564.1 hypothetical protein [Flavobacteriales bacterium]
MKRILFILLCYPLFIIGQNQTVGLFQYDIGSFDGYTLFSPSETTYLIDNCGRLVHSWQSSYNPGNSAYLLEDGNLLRTCRISNSIFSGGGSGGRIEKRDWNNNLVWSYDFSNNTYHQHHDIEPMPNGNILVLCWEYKSLIDVILSGRDPSSLADNELWPSYILEVEPQGNNGINIVWEWHLWDHLVQDFDPSKVNYGVVANHSELLDINFYAGAGKKDWLHCNSIDYNEDLDQIVISSRALSEFYIIDHSTTTTEAATNSGGNSGKGGDILYRWGNPAGYNSGTTADQKLFGQHNVHWIDENFEDGGKLMLFNNGQGRGFSSIDILSPPTDVNDDYFLSANTFGPSNVEWTYTDPNPTNFYASFISGAQRLPNGNTLICDGAHGTFFEIDSTDTKVWKYINPVVNSVPLAQGNNIPTTNNGWANSTFRCTRYSLDYSAFIGQNLTPGPFIELNPLPSNCQMLSGIDESQISNQNRSLLYITDILGRKITKKCNTPLFYIYDNGTVEKKFIVK